MFDYEVEIPFVENTGRRCVPACAAMVLETLMPETPFIQTEVERMCGFRPDRSTWAARHLLSLSELGLRVGWIEDDDLPHFASNPLGFVSKQTTPEQFKLMKEQNDLLLEAHHVQRYLDRGLPFEQRRATRADIISHALDGLVRLEVNGKILARQDGFANHAVLVSGFNDSVVRLENPDGLYGSKPKQIVTWDELALAREKTQGALHYYALP
jgi:hypothetical protein